MLAMFSYPPPPSIVVVVVVDDERRWWIEAIVEREYPWCRQCPFC